ncbi:hypothetical protein ACEPAF_846 [Sanghuangporus sanghuang]
MLRLFDSIDSVELVTGHSADRGETKEPEHIATSESGESVLSFTSNLPPVLEIIRKSVPSLCDRTRAFKPSWSWSLGDVQTLFGNFASIYAPLTYGRYFVSADSGGALAVDFVSAPWLSLDAPIIIVLPGILGNSQSLYVTSATEYLTRLRNGPVTGYRVAVMNTRGTSGNPLSSAHLTHAGMTDDLRAVVSFVRKCYPESKALFALGFSMGGALLSNYLAEEGDACPIDAGFCVSTVWDLEACAERIEENYLRRLLYSYTIGTSLTRIVHAHEQLFRDAGATGLDELLSRSAVRMSAFNDIFMSHLAGYSDTAAFAAATSPIFRVGKIRRPCVLLNAHDDPFYGGDCLEDLRKRVRESGYDGLVLTITKKGGHVGWLQRNREGNIEQWFARPVREFFDTILSEKILWQNNRKKHV